MNRHARLFVQWPFSNAIHGAEKLDAAQVRRQRAIRAETGDANAHCAIRGHGRRRGGSDSGTRSRGTRRRGRRTISTRRFSRPVLSITSGKRARRGGLDAFVLVERKAVDTRRTGGGQRSGARLVSES